jgi:hypothetical protein
MEGDRLWLAATSSPLQRNPCLSLHLARSFSELLGSSCNELREQPVRLSLTPCRKQGKSLYSVLFSQPFPLEQSSNGRGWYRKETVSATVF